MKLILFEDWLERKIKTYFNPLCDITTAEDTSPRQQNPKMNKILKAIDILSENKDDNVMRATDGKEESKNIKCWIYIKLHQLMDCDNFKGKTTDERKDLSSPKDFVIAIFQKCHAIKLTNKTARQTSDITNFILHHTVTNFNKPIKVRVVFDTAAKHKSTLLKRLKSPDLHTSLTGVLITFRKGKYAVITDTEQMFHLIFEIPKHATNSLEGYSFKQN